MALSAKTTMLWSLSLTILLFGITSSDVVNVPTNPTSPKLLSIEEITEIDDALSEKNLESNANTCGSIGPCENGGRCVNRDGGRSYCRCKNGTSGMRCEVVDECEKNSTKCGIEPDVQCTYDVSMETAECLCSNLSKAFDSFKKQCRVPCEAAGDCPRNINCVKNVDNDLRFCRCAFGTGGDRCDEKFDECKAVGKDCGNNPNVTCKPYAPPECFCEGSNRYAFNPDVKDCVKCDCEQHYISCKFRPGGKKECFCYGRYYQVGEKCTACNCGAGSGGCVSKNGTKVCKCFDGYLQVNDTCQLCDCGSNSIKCSFQDGQKICSCKDGYLPFNGTCKKTCKAGDIRDKCQNGGTCKDSVCQCLPGTNGNRCEIIVGCETESEAFKTCNYGRGTVCLYNQTSQTSFCRCKESDNVVDPFERQCRKCDCGPHGKCNLNRGWRSCVCEKGYKEKPGDYITKSKCEQCSCGPNGACSFTRFGNKVCNCVYGYIDQNGFCLPCDCGIHGECDLNEFGEKICNCEDGYGVQDGTCTNCLCTLYGESVNCTFPNGKKKCTCPEGYEEKMQDFCSDINECENESICPLNTECRNKIGSYECECKKGYRPYVDHMETKRYGCTDIDECEEEYKCRFRDTTECINSEGSYSCVCKAGYYNPYTISGPENLGCSKDQSGWRTGYIILIVAFLIVIIGLIIAIFKKRM